MKYGRPSLALLAAAALVPACSSTPPPETQPTPPQQHAAFENPGGMWMPEQIAEQSSTLRSLGLELDPAALAQPTSDTLSAIVSLGGCSASFVSDDGLIATNHHCSVGALQLNSTPKENLLRDGFLAKTRAEERSAGPTARVFVTRSLRDVTKDVTDGLAAIPSDLARQKKVEERTKALVAACEKGRPELRCSVAEFFGGGGYRLIEQLEIKDVRLVFAPHEGIGNFGGEIDNWRWPRHTGDVSFLRAYVGKDGKPAAYSEANVPYKPPHHLKLASKPLAAGDLVFVAGYPAVTNRLRTASEAAEALSWSYPHKIKWCEENIALLDQISSKSEELALKARPRARGLNNQLTKMRGIVDGLSKGALLEQRTRLDADLKKWIDADPARKAAYGDVLDKIAAIVAEDRKTREADLATWQMNRLVSLVSSAQVIVRVAEERAKPDAERDPAYQERNWARIEQEQTTMQKRYDRGLDRALFKLAIQRALRVPEKERPPFIAALLDKAEPTEAAIDKALGHLYDGTALEDLAARLALLRTATTADLAKSKDPMIQLAMKLRPAQKATEDRDHAEEGALLLLRPRYVEALRKFRAETAPSAPPIAPDANGTLRVTYGTVRGYRPKPEAPIYRPFTTISEMLQKTGKHPFDTPGPLLDAAKAKRFGAYVDSALGEVPIDFLSDLDITGGNSGSATLNGRGEIVGLAFDGNYEAMASDWLFMPSVTRTIHVDMRYVLWLLDAVAGGDHLIKEMGGTPSVQ